MAMREDCSRGSRAMLCQILQTQAERACTPYGALCSAWLGWQGRTMMSLANQSLQPENCAVPALAPHFSEGLDSTVRLQRADFLVGLL
jgi:hypothetical protein